MVKIKVKQSTSPKFFIVIIGLLIIAIPIIIGINEIKMSGGDNNSSESSIPNYSRVQIIFSKDDNLRTFEEWKQIADYRAEEYYECMKNSDLSDTYTNESCSITYNNNWVEFRDGLEEKANLSYDQQKVLKDYWHKTRDMMTEKIKALFKRNDKNKRPNYYE
jgi:hypothetical protein